MKKNNMELNKISTNIYKNHLKNYQHNIIMETTSTNNNMNNNCKIKKCFGINMYYNVVTLQQKKILLKENKYTSPLLMAICNRKDDEYTIKYDEEVGKKIYTKYGNMSYDMISKYGWKTNNHLFEIIPKGHCHKLYFDIDKRFESDENNDLIIQTIIDLIKDVMKIDITNYITMCKGKGTRDDYIKVSYHMIINNGFYFKNMEDAKKVFKILNFNVIKDNKYDCLRNGVLDFNVYKNNQAFKLPYNSKAFKNIIQTPINHKSTLKDFLLTNVIENPQYYNVDKYNEIDVQPKIIKCASGKSMKLNFDEALIFKEYYNDIGGKSFNLEKIDGNKSDGLPYYLNSIPNSPKVSHSIFKIVGWCISRITKNSEEGLKLYCQWVQAYKAINIEELRNDYMMNSTTKGYGWKMLYKLAKLFNKNIDKNDSIYYPLFDDEPTFKCEKKKINNRFIECNEYNMVDTINKYDIICIKSPMGTGKSYSLKKIFQSKKYKSIIYFSSKRAFASSMISDYNEYGFVNYLDVNMKSDIEKEDRIICSVESIHYCRDKYDLVIIDESESIADNLMGAMFIKNKPIEGSCKIYDMIKNSKKIMLMDAYLTSRSFDMVKDIYGDDIINKKAHYLNNTFKYDKREYIECDKKSFVNEILKKLKNNKRCVVVCGSKKLSDYIKIECKDYNIKAYDNRNQLPLCCDVNKEWENCDLLIYTPTITCGISYDNVTKHFDTLFIYAVNIGSCHFRDTIQAHKRVRHFTSTIIYICLNDKFKGHPIDIMPLTKDGIRDIEDKYKAQLFGDEVKTLKNMDKLSFIYNINIHNKLEKNISSICLNGFAKKYLYEENIIPIKNINSVDSIEFENDIWLFNDIETINKAERDNIKQKFNNMNIDREILDEEDIKKMIKYNYSQEQCEENLCETIKQEFFDEYYSDKICRNKMSSVRSFKEMLHSIKFDFMKFAEHRDNLKSVEGLPIEMYDMKIKRYEHLLGFFNQLGFINKEDKKFNIDTEFVGGDLNKMAEFYKNIDIKALNTMLSDGHIKSKKNDDGLLNSKQLKGIFNQLLMDEFGLEVYGCGLKHIRINGKKKKLTKMSLRNYISKENKKDEEYISKFGSSEYNRFNIYTDKSKNTVCENQKIHDPSPLDDGISDSDEYSEDDSECADSEDDDNLKGACEICGKPCYLKKCIKCLLLK